VRSFLAGLALLLAGLLGTAALTAYLVHQTVLDPHRPGQVLSAVLDQPQVRHRVLDTAIPGYASLPPAQRHQVNHLLSDPRLQHAIKKVRVNGRGEVQLAPLRHRLAQGLRSHGQPQLAQMVSTAGGDATFALPNPVADKYDAGRRLTHEVTTRAGLAAIALFALALAVAHDRRRALRRIGLIVLAGCAGSLAIFWLLPDLASTLSSSIWVNAVAATTRAFGSDAVKGLIPVAVVGVVLFAGSFLLPRPAPRAWDYY
jgi:hypothetical protein